MRKLILAMLAVAAVVIVAAGIFLTSRIRSVSADLAQRVESQTGVQVRSSGLPGISLWPRFSVSLGNVVIPATKGSASAPLATVETMRIVPAGGLLGLGNEGILEIVLERPSINLIVNADGLANWNYGAKAPERESQGLPFRIVEGRIAFLDERSGAAAEITNVDSQISVASPADELTAKGVFVWNERRAAFTFFLKSPQRVAEDGSPADVTLQAPGFAFEFSGRAAITKGFELDGQAEIKATDLGLAASWFGAALPAGLTGARFELAGAVGTSNTGLAFTNAQFGLDDMRGEGDIAMALGRERPTVAAKIEAQTIDLTRYSGMTHASPLSFLSTAWSSKRIEYSALRSFDADLDISARAFAYGAFRTGAARLTANLRDGNLDLKLGKAAYVGGTLDLMLVIDSKAEPPALKFGVTGDGLASDKALLASLGFGEVGGTLSSSLSVSASGRTLAELVSTLKGQASLRIVSGTIKGVDLPRVFSKVANAILDGWDGDERATTVFDAFSATFLVADGIAETGNLTLISPSLSFSGKGEVDVLRQAVDMKIDPQLAVARSTATAPQFATFPVAIQVKGPWTGPRIYPDMPGILEDPASAYAALKKLGLGSSD